MYHLSTICILLALFAVALPSHLIQAATPAKPVISYIFFDGKEPRTEGDEYAVVKNIGGTAINMKGWRLNAGDRGQDFYFPSFVLNPGLQVRIYTNRIVKGSFSFGRRSAIWNNAGDCGILFNAAGKQVHVYPYKAGC